MSSELTVTTSTFNNLVLESKIPILVDFWATWCMPCRAISKSIEEVANIYKDKMAVAKINIDDESDLAIRYNITSIPTLMIFKDGNAVATRIGALPKQEIENMIKKHIDA